jgi:hypothetical protein
MVHFAKIFIIASVVVAPALAVPLPFDADVDLVVRDPFSFKRMWRKVKNTVNVIRPFVKPIANIAKRLPGPAGHIAGVASNVINKIPRELQEEVFTRAMQDELAARGYEVEFDARDYDEALEARDDGVVDLEAREFFSVLAREYADALEARDFDEELAARDFISELEARGFGGDELEVREPEPESLSYDELD